MSPRTQAVVFVFGMDARRIGGIEVQTRELATRLGSHGWQAVLCFSRPPAPEVRQYLSLPNVTWEELPDAGANSWQASWDLLRILRRYRPRLLHLQFTPFLSPNAWIARLNGVKKIVLTDHNSHPEGYLPGREPVWTRAAAKLLNLPVSLIVAVSDYNRHIIASMGSFPLPRLRRIHNGVDLARRNEVARAAGIAFRTRHGIPLDRILITQISQMIPEKGVPDVLEAAQVALSTEPSLHFAFVGDGKYLDEYSRRAIRMGIGDHVTWTGLVIDPVAEGVLMATDIACLASRWQEAFGLVIAEAMSCENPVVATRVGGIPEVVEDGKTGFLVNPGDITALAEKFVLLARDRELRLRLGCAGRERAAECFDVQTNAGRLLDLYGEF